MSAITIETRSVESFRVEGNRLVGVAIPYGKRSKVLPGPRGPFVERIENRAFASSVSAPDVMFLYQHEQKAQLPLGRSGKNLELRATDTGIEFGLELPNTSLGRDVAELVKAEILGGAMSFGMHKIKDRWATVQGMQERSVIDGSLHHISLVIDPVYVNTSAELRGGHDDAAYWLERCWKHSIRK